MLNLKAKGREQGIGNLPIFSTLYNGINVAKYRNNYCTCFSNPPLTTIAFKSYIHIFTSYIQLAFVGFVGPQSKCERGGGGGGGGGGGILLAFRVSNVLMLHFACTTILCGAVIYLTKTIKHEIIMNTAGPLKKRWALCSCSGGPPPPP